MFASRQCKKLSEELDDVDRAMLAMCAKSLREVYDMNAAKDRNSVLITLANEIDEIAVVKRK